MKYAIRFMAMGGFLVLSGCPDCGQNELPAPVSDGWQIWQHAENESVSVEYPEGVGLAIDPGATLNPVCLDTTLPAVIASFSKELEDEFGNRFGWSFTVGYEMQTELPLWQWLDISICPNTFPDEQLTFGQFLQDVGYEILYWDESNHITAHNIEPLTQWSQDWAMWKDGNRLYLAYGRFDLYGFDIETVQVEWLEYQRVIASFPK